MSDLYKSTLQKSESGAIIAKSGKYELRQNQASFARENFSVMNGKEVVELPTNSKRLVLNTLMLRKLAIQDGLTQGIFDTTDAKDYVLPRLEKILEDY